MTSAPFPCDECCNPRECSRCIDDKAPNKFQVVISGLTAASSIPCDDCSVFDGTYVLDFFSNCLYKNIGDGENACEFDRIELLIDFEVGVPYTILVDLTIGGSAIQYRKEYGSLIDCKNLSNEDIPWDNDPDEQCTGSSSTCKVTSL